MPEGDTLARTARALESALAGRTLTRFASRDTRVEAAARRLRLVGRTIEAVTSKGKHLLVRFAGGPALHTHLRMSGRWHVARTDAARGPQFAPLLLEAGDVTALCFGAPLVEVLTPADEARHRALAHLGPDVLAEDFDPARVQAALRMRAGAAIGEALLDQSVLAGIGNIYRSEVLFLCGVDPATPVAALPDPVLERILAAARALMRRNVQSAQRTPYWVYRRAGRHCRRCAEVIACVRRGHPPRAVYWCPRCQHSAR